MVPRSGLGRWLAALGVAIFVGLQQGTLLGGLGDVGETKVADWTDLLVPWAILGSAGMVLRTVRPPGRVWWIFGAGAVLFVEGHGIHLAANSIDRMHSSDLVHLWDETVSHHLLFSGLGVVLAAVFVSLLRETVRVGPLGWLLAVAVGVSLFNSYVEGVAAILGIVTCAAFVAAGWRRKDTTAGRLALVTYGVAGLLLVGWGAYWQGFPEFTELGWI